MPVPELPNSANANGPTPGADTDKEKETETAPAENTPSTKSPLLTAHRISVTSDMDDVSLEEGIRPLDTAPSLQGELHGAPYWPTWNPTPRRRGNQDYVTNVKQKALNLPVSYPNYLLANPPRADCRVSPAGWTPSSSLPRRLSLRERTSVPLNRPPPRQPGS